MTLQLYLRFYSASPVNSIGLAISKYAQSTFQFIPFRLHFLTLFPVHSFLVSSGVQNRSNGQASDHLMHIERISMLWLQNRDDN